jgi:hypothetical protein
MEAFLPETVKQILLALIAIVLVLGWLSRAFPDVAWLRVFRLPAPHLSEDERARRKRAGNRMAGLEIALLGLALPLFYVASTVMMFNNFKTAPTIIVAVCSLSCVALGVWVFAHNRERG